MPLDPAQELTQLLGAWSRGDRTALDRLIPLVHEELRRMARGRIGKERSGHTLQATALVNELYLKLIKAGTEFEWRDRSHFFAACAQGMRRILIDHARSHASEKRGGGALQVTLEEGLLATEAKAVDLIALDEALSRLEALDAQKARIVELRYFAGLDLEETAELVGVSVMTVRREWDRARLWLMRFIAEGVQT